MSAYSAAVLADSPVAYWRLDESSGTVAADQTTGHNGTYTGGFTLSQTGALVGSGDLDAATAFNGTTGLVSVPASAAINGLTNYTLEAWIKPTDLLLQYAWLSTFNVQLSVRTDGKLQVDHQHIAAVVSTATVPTGAYSYVVITYDGTNVLVYINGVLDSTTAVATPRTTSGLAAIGQNAEGVNHFFKGAIDEAAIYNTTLSATRILAHYNAGIGSPATAVTNAATNIGAASATLNGTVNPDNLDATVHFEYGLTTAYGTSTANQDAGAGSSPVAITAALSSLSPTTTYHYRIVAVNADGTTNGADQTFTTFAYAVLPGPITTAQWEFILTDAAGNALAELTTAAGRTISYKRNTYTEVNLTLSHEDDAAGLLLSALATTGVPKLRGYRRSPNDAPGAPATLRFRGPLAALSETSEETSLLTATFRSPFGVLLGDGSTTGRIVQGSVTPGDGFPLIYSATDAGLIAKSLIDIANADSPTGLGTDPALVVATMLRDRTYPVAQNIGSAITDLTSVLDGFDFFESFVDGTGATDAMFNVVASQGVVNSGARFEYGERTLSNISQLTRTTLPPANCVFVTGGNGLSATYSDTASVTKYGKWWTRADFSTVIELSTLNDKAKALCRPNPVKTVLFVPELGLDSCPKPFDDWNLGDTVPLLAARSSLTENTQLRINGFILPIDENGLETVQVDNPTTPEEDSVITAALIAEVV